jgi:hypothetical protein
VVRELHRLLDKKTLETEILKEALEVAAGPKKRCCARCRSRGTVLRSSAVCTVLDVARSNIAERMAGRPYKRLGRPPQPDDDLLAVIKA